MQKLFLALAFLSMACGSARAGDTTLVVASFSIIGDFVRRVGGDRITLTTLVGPDGDAHVYEPGPKDVRDVAQARVAFVNGLGMEGWLSRLIASAGRKATVVTLGESVTARREPDGLDPHAWQDVGNAIAYVGAIRDALVAADPPGKQQYEANAAAYLQDLKTLDAEIVALFAAVPPGRRRVVSTHDAFGYFGARYGVAFIAPQGVSTDAEPSARDVSRIIESVRREQVGAVFLENVADTRLARRIVAETGARLGGVLYSDALSADAPTYIDMMRHNARELAKALAP